MLQAERSEGSEPGDHTLISEVAENQMKTSLLKSLQTSTPKTYMICLHLNLHKQLQIQLNIRGLSAKVHLMDFEKVQLMKRLSPCNSLCKTTQKSYMIWAICKLSQSSKIKKSRGGYLQNDQTSICKGVRCKNEYHH